MMEDIAKLVAKVQQEILLLCRQRGLVIHQKDASIKSFISELSNGQIRTIGLEVAFGSTYL